MQRVIHEITIGGAKATAKRDEQNRELGLEELDLQFQLPISGTATPNVAWSSVEIVFDVEFHYAPAQRDSDLEVPHMTYGAYLPVGQVGIVAMVRSWKVEPKNDGITGCTLNIGCFASSSQAFTGDLHVTFQGFGMSRDDLSDNPDLEV